MLRGPRLSWITVGSHAIDPQSARRLWDMSEQMLWVTPSQDLETRHDTIRDASA